MKLDTRTLSCRAQNLLAGQSMPEYLVRHFEGSTNPYHADANPDGYIGLCVAENKLVSDLVADRINRIRDVPASVLGYDSMTGSMRFRERLGRFMGRTFLGREFPPHQISVLAGAGSVLEILFHALGDPGDGVLAPTPSYAGFWMDLELRNELRIVPVHTSADGGFRLTPELLDRAADGADRPVRALLLTTPDNPLGRVYTADELDAILSWAEGRGLHVVADEIYALSVYGGRPFTSCAAVRQSLGDRLHIVWAFSKDFGASGLRCGVVVSENEAVTAAVSALAYWACCSGHTQYLLGEMISDESWVDGFIDTMQTRLGRAYDRLTTLLDAGGISHIPAEGAVFTLVDLRPHLAEPTWEAEHDLWTRIIDEARVNLTPGAACHIGEPGFMRLCYAGLPTNDVAVGVERLVDFLG
ncbi:MAG: aminotransferase class I/II-fold pyridoxal phosphate-dependent enzyme [Thermoanaerobaculales bacterium]|jgi:aspartate/methionine/tyrosine aminotransferase|nr:aminotransferase class I/II-fold pyridoxal phosphate-dependent enzyme [Thermoanaerobaculales bacterium]